MIKYFFQAFTFIMIITVSYPQVNVTILVHTSVPGDSDKVYVSGNKPSLGNWNPGAAVLEKINENTWGRTFKFDKNESLEFKFTLGQWSREGLEKENVKQGNYIHQTYKDTTLEYNISSWGTVSVVKGQITGKLIYHRNFESRNVDPRDISVLLPSGYNEDTSKRYPVIYAHDGQNLFDPKTSAFGIDWQVDETTDSLVKARRMKPVIIVAVNNTPLRSREYSYSDTGYAYMKFIVEELKPFIDRNYRTLPDRENTATLGSSRGGLISFMLLWEHTEVFSKAACFSPALKIRALNYLPYIENYEGPAKEIQLYIDNGGIGLEQDLQPGIDEAVELLKKKGYEQGTDFIVFYDKNAQHNEAAWAERVWRPLLFFFGTK